MTPSSKQLLNFSQFTQFLTTIHIENTFYPLTKKNHNQMTNDFISRYFFQVEAIKNDSG